MPAKRKDRQPQIEIVSTDLRDRFGQILVATGLFAAYAATRFIGLTKLPIFVDEGGHLAWALKVWKGFPFTPLEDGKLLQVWLASLVVPWASDHYGRRAR